MESLPCQREMIGECRVFITEGTCRQDVHHTKWPKNEYVTPTEKEYRELDVNKVFICRALHNAIHAANRTSIKPSVETMKSAIHDQQITNNHGDGRIIHGKRHS